jgi:hypothetical protein
MSLGLWEFFWNAAQQWGTPPNATPAGQNGVQFFIRRKLRQLRRSKLYPFSGATPPAANANLAGLNGTQFFISRKLRWNRRRQQLYPFQFQQQEGFTGGSTYFRPRKSWWQPRKKIYPFAGAAPANANLAGISGTQFFIKRRLWKRRRQLYPFAGAPAAPAFVWKPRRSFRIKRTVIFQRYNYFAPGAAIVQPLAWKAPRKPKRKPRFNWRFFRPKKLYPFQFQQFGTGGSRIYFKSARLQFRRRPRLYPFVFAAAPSAALVWKPPRRLKRRQRLNWRFFRRKQLYPILQPALVWKAQRRLKRRAKLRFNRRRLYPVFAAPPTGPALVYRKPNRMRLKRTIIMNRGTMGNLMTLPTPPPPVTATQFSLPFFATPGQLKSW